MNNDYFPFENTFPGPAMTRNAMIHVSRMQRAMVNNANHPNNQTNRQPENVEKFQIAENQQAAKNVLAIHAHQGRSKKVTTSPVSFAKLVGEDFRRRMKTKTSPLAPLVFKATKSTIMKIQLRGASSKSSSPAAPMTTSGPSVVMAN